MNQSIRKETNNNMSPILSEENCKYIGHILTTENKSPSICIHVAIRAQTKMKTKNEEKKLHRTIMRSNC